APLEIEKVERIVRNCKENGLMIRNLENVITFVPVLSMSNKEVKTMVRIFKKAVHNILDRKC
ncbi:adenosylmethionine--8-amino-7-oxononanoate transaminase, partial [Staphylococcus aureus]|nr:adenosylmethionine--8-amino-7-oxononanoate transaminase [Staphylococcus aureus]